MTTRAPKDNVTTSMNVTGTNPDSTTNIGEDPVVAGERNWDDVRTRVEQVSGISVEGAEYSEDEPDEDSVEAFEKAYAKAYPETAPGTGRQYANVAKGMGYSVKLKAK